FADQAVIVKVLGDTANAVAAHLGFTAVGVVHAHACVGLVGGADQDETVGSDAEMTVADPAAQARRIVRYWAGETIDVDVIVPAPFLLGESHIILGTIGGYFLLPFNRRGRFAADVVHDAVAPRHTVDDTGRDFRE